MLLQLVVYCDAVYLSVWKIILQSNFVVGMYKINIYIYKEYEEKINKIKKTKFDNNIAVDRTKPIAALVWSSHALYVVFNTRKLNWNSVIFSYRPILGRNLILQYFHWKFQWTLLLFFLFFRSYIRNPSTRIKPS